MLWTLGGKASSFRLGPGARFYFQHDARLLPGNRVSLFDDEGGPPFKARSSRGLILRLDARRHRGAGPPVPRPGNDTLAESEGSVQTLAGANELVGFGSERYFSEFAPERPAAVRAGLPVDDGSYRVFGAPWVGDAGDQTFGNRASGSPPPVCQFMPAGTARPPSCAGRSWRAQVGGAEADRSAPDRAFETQIGVPGRANEFESAARSSSQRPHPCQIGLRWRAS